MGNISYCFSYNSARIPIILYWSGLRLMVERFFTDEQLIEGKYVKVTKFEVYNIPY